MHFKAVPHSWSRYFSLWRVVSLQCLHYYDIDSIYLAQDLKDERGSNYEMSISWSLWDFLYFYVGFVYSSRSTFSICEAWHGRKIGTFISKLLDMWTLIYRKNYSLNPTKGNWQTTIGFRHFTLFANVENLRAKFNVMHVRIYWDIKTDLMYWTWGKLINALPATVRRAIVLSFAYVYGSTSTTPT